MKVNLKLSRVGMNMESATVSAWRKTPGETFVKGEILYDIETEKVTMEVEAPCNGKLMVIEVPAGSETNVGDVVCQIETS